MGNAWYPFYSGDYGRDTAHLSLMEHGAFRLLLDYYYAGQAPLPADNVALYRICRAYEESERLAVDSVVRQFFLLEDERYHNDRADRELTKQAERTTRLSGSGRRGAMKRWSANSQANNHPRGKANDQVDGVSMANPQPQPQPEKETTKATNGGASFELPDWIPLDAWTKYMALRRAKHSKVTPDAVELLIRKLAAWRDEGQDVREILERSVMNGWKGLFPLPKEKANAGGTTVKSFDAVRRENTDAALSRFIKRNSDSGVSAGPALPQRVG